MEEGLLLAIACQLAGDIDLPAWPKRAVVDAWRSRAASTLGRKVQWNVVGVMRGALREYAIRGATWCAQTQASHGDGGESMVVTPNEHGEPEKVNAIVRPWSRWNAPCRQNDGHLSHCWTRLSSVRLGHARDTVKIVSAALTAFDRYYAKDRAAGPEGGSRGGNH